MWNKAGQRSYDCYSTFELVNRSIDSGSMNHSLFCLGLDWILMKRTDMFSVCLALITQIKNYKQKWPPHFSPHEITNATIKNDFEKEIATTR